MKRISWIGIGLMVVLFLLGSATWLLYEVRYVKSENRSIAKLAQVLRLDAAEVNGVPIPYSEYLTHKAIINKMVATAPMGAEQPEMPDASLLAVEALNRAIRIEAIRQLASEANIQPTQAQVEQVFSEFVQERASSTGVTITPEEMIQGFEVISGATKQQMFDLVFLPAMQEQALANRATSQEAFEQQLEELITKKTKRYLKF